MVCRLASALGLLAATLLVAGAAPIAQAQQDRPAAPAKTAEPVRFSIVIRNRKVDAVQQRIRVTQGDVVELAFASDEPAELHLHGYDRLVTVAPNAPAVLRLDANVAGRFSIEAHRFGGGTGGARKQGRGHVVLLYLDVYPR
jgi:FtsP/CotA-like multicopper oxidase with cupredoxin domain